MTEFKIDGRMTVRKLKENFKNEFKGTLRVYDGRELADDKATLASIRKGDAKGGEFVCRASRTVGKFEEEMKQNFGIRVQVASPDDYILALDGITLANLKNIKEKATKDDMEKLVAYKRKANKSKANVGVADSSEDKVKIDYKFESLPVFDFKFKKIDWALNDENIEEYRDEIDQFGVVYVRALNEDGDFETKVIANCDIADGLYDAKEAVEDFTEDGWETIEVYYTTVCEVYGEGEFYEHGDDCGYVVSALLGVDSCDNDYSYQFDTAAICRATWDNAVQVWQTNGWGDFEENIDLNIDILIEYKKDPESFAGKIEWEKPKIQCLNTKKELLFEFVATSISEKVSPKGLIKVEFDDKFGFINEKGEEVVPYKYDSASDFSSNGLAIVRIDGQYGYINEKGEEVIPCKYEDADDFSSNGFAKVEIDGQYGYINEKGEEVIPCKYDYANDFSSNGLASVEIDGQYGYINEKGEEVIPCKYEDANDFSSNGLAKVEIDEKYGYINEKGEEVIPCKYDNVYGFSSNGLAIVKIDEKYGYINEKGEEVIPCKYDYVYDFSSNGFAKVKIDEKYGYINEKGEEVILCKYDFANDFSSNGLAAVEIDEKYGYINEKGEEVIPCKYEDADDFSSNGFAKVEIDGQYGYINEKGEEVIPCKYDYANNFSSNGLAKVKIDEKYGYINEKGEEVIPCKYEDTNDFSSNGLAIVIIDEKYGYINEKGEEVIPCEYEDITFIDSKELFFVKK